MTDYIALRGFNTGARITNPMIPNMVNCYDQASAVLVFAGIMGIEGHKRYVQPFGYITETTLVGGIRTNSPFHSGLSPAIVPRNDPNRTFFSNHEFYMDKASAKVFDACAGPHLGTEDAYTYLDNSVDTGKPLPSGRWRLEKGVTDRR